MAATTLILGGGFGGIAAANTLRALAPDEHAVVVVDRSDTFHVGAGKTWLMLGTHQYTDISRPRRRLLAPGVRFIQASVQALDVANRTATLDDTTLAWDFLVVALGADVNLARVPGLAEAAHTFYTVEGAQRLKTALDAFSGGDIVLLIPQAPFKCPPAPYEAAMLLHAALAERGLGEKTRLAIHTVEGAPMATAGPAIGRFIEDELAQRGIAFHPRRKTVRVDGAARRCLFEDGSEASYDLLIAVPPHESPRVVRDAGLTNPAGWVPADPLTLRATAAPGGAPVYAVGDITAVPLPGRYLSDVALALPKAGVFAAAQGQVVAQHIAAAVTGGEASAKFDGIGFCYLELGNRQAVKAEGDFFALPHPAVEPQPADEAQWRDKQAWVARQLRLVG